MPNPNPTPFGYRDATGTRHQVLVRQTHEGVWQVLDVNVIDTLTGVGEGREEAEALAREYVTQQQHPTATARRPSSNRSAA